MVIKTKIIDKKELVTCLNISYTTSYQTRRMVREFLRSLNSHIRRRQAFPIDLAIVEDTIVIYADLPGVRKDDISVNVSSRSVIITALSPPSELKVKRYLIRERVKPASRMKRIIDIPAEVDIGRVKAHFSGGNGVLKITIPLKAEINFNQT